MNDVFKKWWAVVHSEADMEGWCSRAFQRGREDGYEQGWTDGRNSENSRYPLCVKCGSVMERIGPDKWQCGCHDKSMDMVLDYFEPRPIEEER